MASEPPAGLGFGDAALAVAGVLAMNPWTAQGDPVDGARIRLPVRLELPADAPATAAAAGEALAAAGRLCRQHRTRPPSRGALPLQIV